MYFSLRIVLFLALIGLTGCTLFVQTPEEIDVAIPTSVSTIPSPTATLTTATEVVSNTTTTPTVDTPSATPIISASETPLAASPAVQETSTPESQPSVVVTFTATATPVTVVFLTQTAEWQPVQAGHTTFELPLGWIQYFPEGDSAVFFVNVDSTTVPIESIEPGIAWVRYSEIEPEAPPNDWTEATVDGYTAVYDVYTNYDEPPYIFDVAWQSSLRIYTTQRRITIELRCNANRLLDEPSQRQFHQDCDSLLHHWIDTTQIFE